ncbi:CocE/NonD family hydrolase C-terminal non-catalytic domain-containing protein [Streptomyces kanamyceticus]|uniref:CocE/NonD family hydrolase C-terminal non-catalytic domain-containing protein n=1 Tax=Streptomyces kanamyceticus TaxID=1967 RepID=UPI0037DD5D2D
MHIAVVLEVRRQIVLRVLPPARARHPDLPPPQRHEHAQLVGDALHPAALVRHRLAPLLAHHPRQRDLLHLVEERAFLGEGLVQIPLQQVNGSTRTARRCGHSPRSTQGALAQDVTERGASILRYKGSDGRLRGSMRHLDKTLATDDVPAHTFDRVEKLSPGEVVDVEIDLLPVRLTFHPCEQLRLVISGRSLLGTMMPGIREYEPANSGRHIVHTGGDRASYLQLPVKTR